MTSKPALALIAIAISILFTAHPAFSGEKTPQVMEDTRLLMGTPVKIQVPLVQGQDEKASRAAIDKAFGEIARIEGVFSVYKADSEISKINGSKAGEAVHVSAEVLGLVERSIECSKKTQGAFDITVKPLVDLWHAAASNNKLPSDEEIRSALGRVGSQYVTLDKTAGTITFAKEGMALDFGGIAKGYATDRAVAVLKECGITNALVSSGGNTYCLGMKSANEMWKVGIQHPRDAKKVFAALRLKDKAIDTAGDYEKYFMLEGKRYSHIIDPRTGYPVGDNVVSATIVGDSATDADMLSTALCVLGAQGLGVADSAGVDALLIIKDGDKLKTEMAGGFKTQYDKAKKK